MSVDEGHGSIIGDGYLCGRNPDELAILLVGRIDGQEALTLAGLNQQPEVGESGKAGTGDIVQTPALEVGSQEVGQGQAHDDIGRGVEREQHGRRSWPRDRPVIGGRKRRDEVMEGGSPKRRGLTAVTVDTSSGRREIQSQSESESESES